MMKEEIQDETQIPHIIQIDQHTGKIINVPDDQVYDPEKHDPMEAEGMLKTVGVVVPKGVKSNLSFLKNAREYALAPDNDIHEQIRMSKIMYYREGLIGTAIDIFCDYAATKMDIEGIGEKERDILLWWFDHVNMTNNNMTTGLRGLINELMLEYWLSGNVFSFRVDHLVPSIDIGSKNIRGKTLVLPMEVYLIDPLFIEIPETPTIIGNKKIFMKLDTEFLSLLRSGDDEAAAILDGLPEDIRRRIVKGEDKVLLPMEFITHIKRKSLGYQTWGVPYLTKCFGDLARKKKLQQLDESTIDGLINQVTIFKIGDIKDETRQSWDPKRLRAFASLLAQPNHSNYLVWAPDVEAITVGPSEAILEFDKKYQQVDQQILKSIGIPTVLLSGEGAAADRAEGNAYVALSSLMEKIEAARAQIKQYIEEMMLGILKANKEAGINVDVRTKPILSWLKPNLINEKEFREFVLAMFDRGLLPHSTTITEARYDFDTIVRKKIEEVEEGVGREKKMPVEKVFFPPSLPFSAPGEGAPGTPDGKGRPPGSTKDAPPPPGEEITPETTFDSAFSGLIKAEVASMMSDIKTNLEHDPVLRIVAGVERLRTVAFNLCELTLHEYPPIEKVLEDCTTSLNRRVSHAAQHDDVDLISQAFRMYLSDLHDGFVEAGMRQEKG
jgi:hypothetical protein